MSYADWQKVVGIGLESTWSTGVDAAIPVPVLELPNFDIGRDTAESNSYTGRPFVRSDVKQRMRTKKPPMINFSFDGNCDYLVIFLYSFFQRVWESATTPYPKNYIPYTKSPDFSAKSSSSYPCTISVVANNNVDDKGYKIDGSVASTLHFECGEDNPILKITSNLQGRYMTTSDATQTGDDFTSFSTANPLIWENAMVLVAKEGSSAGKQGIFSIKSSDATQVIVDSDQSSYIATGDYITFRITISSSNDAIVIEEDGGNTVTITITQGVYTPWELALELQEKINQSSSLNNSYRVSFDLKDRKYLFERDSGSANFRVDEEDASMEMNGTLGFDGTNDAVGISYISDNSVTWNAKAYVITNVSVATDTTITVSLDRDPTETTVPQSIEIWHNMDCRGFSLDLQNNVESPFFNNTNIQNHILGRIFGNGSITIPWGQISSNENESIDYLSSGYRVPIIIYWGDMGESDNDLVLKFNAFYSNVNESGDVLRENEIPFDLVRDKEYSDRFNLPIQIICADGSDKGWGTDG